MSTVHNPPDRLLYSSRPRRSREEDCFLYHVFFITGNPGLIGYYEPFLSTLSSLLAISKHQFRILGTSLSGFENYASSTRVKNGHRPPYGLLQQIELAEERLREFVRQDQETSSEQRQRRSPAKVILIGHSVGAYILLELIRRHPTGTAETEGHLMDIVGGILLFPTVTHIAKSPSGLRFSSILQLPYFAFLIGELVRILVALLPESLLYQLLRRVTAFPDHAARTTVAFLRSHLGVTQVLYMAKDEMQMITDDKWGEEVWGVARDTTTSGYEDMGRRAPSPQLIFYFGENDHWVANNTRDSLIAARGSPANESRKLGNKTPLMLIDREGVSHGFCINHSETMARKVRTWIEDIIQRG